MRPSDEKRALRPEIIARRSRLTQEERFEKSRLVAERVAALPAFRDARTVALYSPLGTEVDALQLAQLAVERGAHLVFPRAVPGERRLVFARCDPDALVRGPLTAGEPPAGAPLVAPEDIDCVVLPGVAFSEDGGRLGRGGGYYDATLRGMPRASRVGIVYDVQIVPTLPLEPHDAAVDAVVSEARTLLFTREYP